MTENQNPIIEAVLTGCEADSLVTVRQAQVNVTFAGFEGDKHGGMTRLSDSRTPWYTRGTEIRNDRQVSIVALEELAQAAQALGVPELLPEWLGANLLTRGLPGLTRLAPLTRLFFAGGVVLVVTAENHPCIHPGKVIAAQYAMPGLAAHFPKAAAHLRGVVAVVERPGVIAQGEAIVRVMG